MPNNIYTLFVHANIVIDRYIMFSSAEMRERERKKERERERERESDTHGIRTNRQSRVFMLYRHLLPKRGRIQLFMSRVF